MSAAVKPSAGGDATAFLASLGLHVALLAVPLLATLHHRPAPPRPDTLPNSVAMVGNSIEVDAPTPEVAAASAAAAAPAAEPEPEPVDVKSLPEAAPAPREPPRAARKTPSKPKSPSASSEASGAVAPSQPSTTGAPAAGTFGQEGLAPGVRRLGYAFARAIPVATPSDSAWRELPAGHVGTIRIELTVDDGNRLGPLKYWHARPGEPEPPAVLQRMVERTLILLRAGQFALSGSNDTGSERITIDVTLRDEAADEEGAPVVVQLTHEAAALGHPGRAYFRYGTGRAVEAKITIVHSGN
ncbi:MAG TPA: hypothetical protein VHP33_07975 [Polyangiaceae bacterium]|nr:hypothetical protein [Polyangiaceae bacterium]